MVWFALSIACRIVSLAWSAAPDTQPVTTYPDNRPAARLSLRAKDQGVVLRYGDGPGRCDELGARDAWVWAFDGTYYMHYDAAGPKGWLCALATSSDLVHWKKRGPVLNLGASDASDSKSASYGVTCFFEGRWHMFYLGTPNTTPPPDLIPAFPYLTLKADAASPSGPWRKRYDIVPFRPQRDTYYSDTASPGQVLKVRDEYRMFFSASVLKDHLIKRTLGIARTKDINGPWQLDPKPMLPLEEQIENTSLYFEPANRTWFLFTNHIGLSGGAEYTDAVWVYWTQDLNRWDPDRKAVVVDGQNCTWSRRCIGLPSVVPAGKRLAVLYDAPGGDSIDHMRRHVGLAWLDLPLKPPTK